MEGALQALLRHWLGSRTAVLPRGHPIPFPTWNLPKAPCRRMEPGTPFSRP